MLPFTFNSKEEHLWGLPQKKGGMRALRDNNISILKININFYRSIEVQTNCKSIDTYHRQREIK